MFIEAIERQQACLQHDKNCTNKCAKTAVTGDDFTLGGANSYIYSKKKY